MHLIGICKITNLRLFSPTNYLHNPLARIPAPYLSTFRIQQPQAPPLRAKQVFAHKHIEVYVTDRLYNSYPLPQLIPQVEFLKG